MEDDRNQQERQEFRDDFRLAVFQIMQYIENELGDGRQRIPPDATEWRLQRAKTIEKLDELRQKLDNTCIAASYGKSVGIGATVAGEITSMLGVIMELRQSSSAQTWKNIGNLVSHSGSLLEGASNIAESFVSAKYLAEIEEVLQRDQELSRPLRDWLAFSRNMDANVREIFGCDLNFAIQNNILKVFSEFTMLYSRSRDFQSTIDLMRRGSSSMDIDVNVPIERLLRFSSHLEMYPELHSNIRTICSTLATSATAIQVVREGVRVYRNLFGEEDLNYRPDRNSGRQLMRANSVASENSVAGYSPSSQGGRDCNSGSPTVGEVSTFCAFQTINIAVNLVHLSAVIMTIKDGKSKYSCALQQISNLLAMELRSMEALEF